MPKLFEDYSNQHPNKAIGSVDPAIAKERFLELYMQTAHFHRTCQILGLVPRTVYHWKVNDPEFAENFEIARGLAITVLEDEAMQRAVYGREEPVFQGGKLVGYVRRYSDTLLVTLLKGAAPDKYRENWKGTLTDGQGKPLTGNLTINHIYTDSKQLANSEAEVEAEIAREQPPTQEADYELLPVPEKKAQDDLLDEI